MFKMQMDRTLRLWMITGNIIIFAFCPIIAQFIDPSPLTGYESIDPNNQILDFLVQGEYIGTSSNDTRIGVQVIALGDSAFDGHFFVGGLPGDGVTDSDDHTSVPGQLVDMTADFSGSGITAAITLSDSTLRGESSEWGTFELKKVFRRSITLEAEPPAGAYVVFGGPEDIGNLENGRVNEYGYINAELVDGSEQYEGKETPFNFPLNNYYIHIEFSNPFQPYNRNQARGNSGILYKTRPSGIETQVLESFGMANQDNHCGGFYGRQKPKLIMSYPPLSWQTYDIFVIGDKINVYHNGVLIQENYTIGNSNDNGRIGLQDHAHPVQYRNIWALETQTIELEPGPVGVRSTVARGRSRHISVGKLIPGLTGMPEASALLNLYRLNGSAFAAGAQRQLMPGVYIQAVGE